MRQQSAAQGRWLVPDPAGLAAVDMTNPQTWNRYAYVMNNPLSSIDPLGLKKGVCDPDAPRHAGCIWGGYTDAGAIGTWGIGAFNDVFGYNDPYYDNMWVSEDITGFTISVTVSSAFSTGKFNLTNPFAKLKQLVPSVCSGGGFGYGAVTIPVAPDVGLESIALVEYDTKGGGAHGGVLGAEFGPAVVGVESLRTWNDWQSHTGPILIGGDEFSDCLSDVWKDHCPRNV